MNFVEDFGWVRQNGFRSGATTIELATGGRALIGRQNIFTLQPRATQLDEHGNYLGAIPLEQINLLGQQLGSDGNLYFVFPDNAQIDVTPQVTVNVPRYGFGVGMTKHKVTIIANNSEPLRPHVVSRNANYSVGQKIILKTILTPEISGITEETHRWNLSGDYVNAIRFWDVNTSSSWTERICHPIRTFAISSLRPVRASKEYVINNDAFAELETGAWWYKASEARVRCAVFIRFLNGQFAIVIPAGKMRLLKPTATLSPASGGNIHLDEDNPAKLTCSFGVPIYVGSEFFGEIEVTQLINAERAGDPVLGLPPWEHGTDGEYMADNGEFYGVGVPVLPGLLAYINFTDDPFQPGRTYIRVDDLFHSYVRFRPVYSDSIWVTLGRFDWEWHGTAQKQGGTWTITRQTVSGPTFYRNDSSFPSWEHIISNLSLSF